LTAKDAARVYKKTDYEQSNKRIILKKKGEKGPQPGLLPAAEGEFQGVMEAAPERGPRGKKIPTPVEDTPPEEA